MEKLKDCRINKGYSHMAMANKLGISKTYYWQLENGARRISYEMAVKIASIFKMRPDDLFYDDINRKG